MNPNTPIVLAAFGTTSKALDTYSAIDAALKGTFPGHPIHWAYTSRMVRSHMQKKRRANMKDPRQVLDGLAAQGHAWAVVQSLHLICGHEFYRLLDDVKDCALRTSMGLPLLTSPGDYRDLAAILLESGLPANGDATVLVGHGTDHPAWCAYPALQQIIQISGANIHVATVEGASEMQTTIQAVIHSGAKHVRLVPLMLVAGVHLQEDIAGDEDSWKRAFLDAGIEVTVDENGLGKSPPVMDIFVKHIRDALAVIPETSVSG